MFWRKKQTESPLMVPPTNIELVDFLYFADYYRDSVLKIGLDKNRIPYLVKCRVSSSIFIEFCSPVFEYRSFHVRGQLRYDRKDQLEDRLWILFIDVPDQYVSQGIGAAIMEGIIRYAKLAGVSKVEGEQRWGNEDQHRRQNNFYRKFRFNFIERSDGKIDVSLDMNKWIFEEN